MHADHSRRLACHTFALIAEAVGTVFVFLDAVRINGTLRLSGNASFAGEPAQYAAWYYHGLLPGFGLILLGIILGSVALWLEHRAIAAAQTRPACERTVHSDTAIQDDAVRAATDSAYPQDISPDELALGFRRMEVDALGRTLEALIVVARVLSASDILVKTLESGGRIVYSHKRWARSWIADSQVPMAPRWQPLLDVIPFESLKAHITLCEQGKLDDLLQTMPGVPGVVPAESPQYRILD